MRRVRYQVKRGEEVNEALACPGLTDLRRTSLASEVLRSGTKGDEDVQPSLGEREDTRQTYSPVQSGVCGPWLDVSWVDSLDMQRWATPPGLKRGCLTRTAFSLDSGPAAALQF
jgi:hypothetical protein